uniref:Uncharacterized protein n=1 Tax=Arundo donax TaxID=35708 RepID=A0A0A9BHT4_ARUDO
MFQLLFGTCKCLGCVGL